MSANHYRRPPLKHLLMIAAMLAPVAMTSCYSYQAVSVERRHGLYRYGVAGDEAGTRKPAARFRVAVRKVFARELAPSPAAAINNRAVDLAVEGRYGQAEILFREVLAEDGSDPAAYNNLGIICELNGSRDEAFRMYLEACRLMPGNDAFRGNFLNFADYRDRKD